MPAQGVHKITEQFERVVSEYSGAPFAVAVDNASNALFLCLMWWKQRNPWSSNNPLYIPARTYPSVPCEIIHAGLKIQFLPVQGETITGPYRLYPSNVWDCALRFRKGMYEPGQLQCLSFTGPKKHLKLGKGGMILTDNAEAAAWFRKARFSGRDECSYHDDDFDKNPVVGWNFYMMPEVAARGLLLMGEFPEDNVDLTIKYPDLSKFKLWQ